MEIDNNLKILRVKLRCNSKKIIEDIINRNVLLNDKDKKLNDEICLFCASLNDLTKEHVLPKWTFENCTTKFFVTDVNGRRQKYNKTTVPVCADCNNSLLGSIESHIISILKGTDLSNSYYNGEQLQNIIRWLEIIEYKFQLLEIRRRFNRAKSSEYIDYLKNIPISIMREEINYSPSIAISQIRLAQKRVTTKSKVKNLNSLVVFKTVNKHFHFFHHLNDFIFIELPNFGVALFYFHSRTFDDNEQAKDEATKIIKRFYN